VNSRVLPSACVGALATVSLLLAPQAVPSASAAIASPGRISEVTAKPGPYAGQVTLSWKATGTNTDKFVLETALSSFGATDHGRHWRTFSVSGRKRSLTLSSSQVAYAGAPVASANYLYYRLRAVNVTRSGSAVTAYPRLGSVAVRPPTPSTSGVAMRVATFNVRTARATSGPSWLSRAPRVAAAIKAKNPGIVAVQELSPGRADGARIPVRDSLRQTESLESALRAAGAGKYRLVRTTAYVAPGVAHGTQGARILYDSTRFRVASSCPETTDGREYSTSCSFSLPILSGDSALQRPSAAYAVMEHRSTGKRFVLMSGHLDSRHSSTTSVEKRYEGLRSAQISTIVAKAARVGNGLPVIFGGDINSWQNNKVGYAAHDKLVASGYFDTAAAKETINRKYPTINHFDTTVKPHPSGFGGRLDVVAVRGIRSATKWVNSLKVTDSARPSDHNMVYADIYLPR
jgi:endonuclease/exonuclease/phosphatase family metal-dependent hydrolase